MPIFLFNNSPGVIGTIVTGQALPFAIVIGGNDVVPEFPIVTAIKAVLTGYRLGGRSGINVAHTMRDRIYVYVYGERAGRAVVSGYAFAGVCDAGGNYTGFDAVYAYYEACRASQNGVPVRLVFGPATTLYGFMSDFEFNLEDANTGVGSFSFMFHVMPRNAVSGSAPTLPWNPLGSQQDSMDTSLSTDE